MIEKFGFPDPRNAEDHGLLALGGDFRPDLLLAAYAHGIFPWPSEEMPYAWFSPNPRMVLVPEALHISRSLRKTLRRGTFHTTFDTAFEAVIRHCAEVHRSADGGTWISEELLQGFLQLHQLGFAHSVESWQGERLVGGLYGLGLGRMFCGESMFHLEPEASKVAFVALVQQLRSWHFRLVDCQLHSDHLEQLGAREWHRDDFLDEVERALEFPTLRGRWSAPEPELLDQTSKKVTAT
ncbi:MAG: leucyl/phenylalanyl-tRNA--protein transferase [Acidobacteriota bacterium]